MLKKALLTLALGMFCLLPSLAEAAPEKTLRVGLGDPINSEAGVAALYFKEVVESRTKGKLGVDIFPNCSIGDEPEMIQNVRSGSLDMCIVGIPNVVPFVKKLGVMTMPYIFDDVYDTVKAANGPAHQLMKGYAEKEGGFTILGWVYSNFRFLSNSVRPVKTIKDIKDLKIRIPASAVMLETYKAWGANPVPVAWSELFTALQQKVVDGQCYGYIFFNAAKLNEAHQKYITELYYTAQIQPMATNMKMLASLSPEIRTIVVEAAKDAQEMAYVYQITESERVKEELVGKGCQVITLEDEDAWKKIAVEKVWPQMEEFIGGRDCLNAYLVALGKKPLQ